MSHFGHQIDQIKWAAPKNVLWINRLDLKDAKVTKTNFTDTKYSNLNLRRVFPLPCL